MSHNDAGDWPVYLGGPGRQQFSQLDQITRDNVGQLEQAWKVETGAGGLQTSPLVIDGMLYAHTPDQTVIALDAATGRQRWRFESGLKSQQPVRGLTYWRDGSDKRLIVSAVNYLYALDLETGAVVESFGKGGRIDLRENLATPAEQNAVFPTTPGVIFGDLLIVGFRTSETPPAPPGDIRAYDVRSGKLRWSFHTIPAAGEPGAETWPAAARARSGAANSWAGLALDDERGIVFVPTGSPTFDYYGGDRPGSNLYANSLVALDARAGTRIWHHQIVHHDIWDRDLPSPPTLLTIRRNGEPLDVVAQTTKHGFVFVFERSTGKPVFPIEERLVAKSETPGEWTAPTQPFPTLPAPFARQRMTEEMITRRTPQAHAAALAQFRMMRSGDQFTPLSATQDTILMPGLDGGAEWGGSAADAEAGILYVNASDVPWFMRLYPAGRGPDVGRGEAVYQAQCAACHGADRKGAPPEFPSLVDVGTRMFSYEIMGVVAGGRGRMPGFPQIPRDDLAALVQYVSTGRDAPGNAARSEVQSAGTARESLPFTIQGFSKFQDLDGYPAIVPPWGTLNAIDLNTGQYLWRVPLGEYPALAAAGVPTTGTENYGGPLVTKSGLLFIGATIWDRKLRAFDARNGKLLWQSVLPYAGNATPLTYSVGGRQFIVIATSGARDRAGPQGSAYVAFTLPN